VFLVWTPAAFAWSWPVHGPVLEPFSYDAAHPYAAGQHRGIDIGAGAAGQSVVAPAAGTVTFAGWVPTSGRTVTIDTADGYAVTLTHLGSVLVAKGAEVAEDDPIGTIGPSGTAEVDVPYVHLGVRRASDPNGYIDPLGVLPAPTDGDPTDGGPSATQPVTNGGSAAAPASPPSASAPPAPVSVSTPPATTRGIVVERPRTRQLRHSRATAGRPRAQARPTQSSRRPAVPAEEEASAGAQRHARVPRLRISPRASEPARSSHQSVAETAAPVEPTGLDAGRELRSSDRGARLPEARPSSDRVPVPLILNGAAAAVALAAALAAARGRRRRRLDSGPIPAPQVVRLPLQAVNLRRVSRAA
jgi:hypothetical protein